MAATREQQAEQRLRRHRARLLIHAPFYGAVGAELDLVIDPTCDTAWTNGKAIGINPDFALGLSGDHLTGVVAHEILHVAMRHNYRRGNRDPQTWNEACDYAINGILVRDGFTLPDDALLDDRFESLSAEQVYAKLVDERDQDDQDGDQQPGDQGDQQDGTQSQQQPGQGSQGNQKQGTQDNQGGVGDVRDASDDAPTEADWQTKIVNHAKLARNLNAVYGNAATDAQDRAAADAAKPNVNWRDVLQQFMTRTTQEDFTWARPNRRHLGGDLHMPSLASEAAGVVAVAIDTSGSVDEQQLARFIAELQGVVDQIQPERVIVWSCDNRLRGTQTFERGDQIQPRIRGGGGTSFAPVFQALDETHEDVACLVYFTDGMARMPKVTPTVPTLWAITVPQSQYERAAATYSFVEPATFGETIYLED